MPITRLLQNASFGPDEIKILVRAFEEALGTLRVDRNDPMSDALAKKIIELAQRGERPARVISLSQWTMASLSLACPARPQSHPPDQVSGHEMTVPPSSVWAQVIATL